MDVNSSSTIYAIASSSGQMFTDMYPVFYLFVAFFLVGLVFVLVTKSIRYVMKKI